LFFGESGWITSWPTIQDKKEILENIRKGCGPYLDRLRAVTREITQLNGYTGVSHKKTPLLGCPICNPAR